ncbi:unnamed protein product [Clonostachys rosea]|uniref:Uncharacterized protein n=1 Tax=Bionectria ochroleuca TaxID=29856 RepID=A0ABY6UJ58_BIOOC|nr:unnamed protein product [Clonostachys rosea]
MLQLFQESLPDEVSPEEYENIHGFTDHPTVDCYLKGKADPQAVIGASMSGDVDILRLALYPPSRTDVESTDYFGQSHGDVTTQSEPGQVILAAMAHAGSWQVYSTLASFFPPRVLEPVKSQRRFRAGEYLRRFSGFGNTEIVQNMLESGVDANGEESRLIPSPLHEACRHGYGDIVDLLIQHGADVNRSCSTHSTPLFQAARGGFIGIVRKLLDKGAICGACEAQASFEAEQSVMAELFLSQLSQEQLDEVFTSLNQPYQKAERIWAVELVNKYRGRLV